MPLAPPVSASDHVRGDLNAPVVLVHYGDFQCPYSGAAFSVIEKLRERMGANLCLVFRHFPLDDVHPRALIAALAAEAAGDQFWAMHDLLFQDQSAIGDANLRDYARQIGLDEEEFVQRVESDQAFEIVQNQMENGRQNGVHGTPTFFINGVFHDNREGLWKMSALAPLLEAAARSHGG